MSESISFDSLSADGLKEYINKLENEINFLRKEKESLSLSKSGYEILFERHNVPSLIIDSESGRIVDANIAACEFYGYSKESFLNTHIFKLQTLSPEQVREEMGRAYAWKRNYFIFKHKLSNGSIKDVEVYSTPFTDRNGRKLLTTLIHDITERVQFEKSIKEDAQRFNYIAKTTKEGIFTVNPDLEITYINDRMTHLLGYSADELIGNKLRNIIHESEIDSHLRRADSLKQGMPEIYERAFKRKDGLPTWFLVSVSPIIDAELNYQGAFFMISDINERKQHEEMLKLSNDKAYAILNASSEAVFLINKSGSILAANDKLAERLKKDKDEIIGRTFWEFFPERIAQREKKYYDKVFASGKPLTYLSDYKSIILESSLFPVIENKEVAYIAVYSADITTRKLAERNIQEAKNKLEKLFIVAPAGMGTTNNRLFTDVNNKLVEMTGYSAKELIGKSAGMLYATEEEYQIAGKALYGQNFNSPSGALESRWRKKSGEIINVEISSAYIYPDNPDFGSIFSVLDVTEQRLYEQKLKEKTDEIEAQNEEYLQINEELHQTNIELLEAKNRAEMANNLKTEFLNNMSHEIRTPMNGIVGFAELLDDNNITADDRKYYSKIVQNSAYQLLRVIDDILEMSILETKQQKLFEEVFNLNYLLKDIFSVFNLKSKEHGLPLYLKKGLKDYEAMVKTDKGKLSKIMENLIENALKFTTVGYVEIGYTIEGSNIQLYVKDTGIGISPQYHDIIFDRFSQEEKDISQKQGGLGLGLSISKENAQLLGGTIRVESQKGKGAVFYVTIPYKKVQTDNPCDDREFTEEHEEKIYNILIAEDEEINFLYLETILEKMPEPKFNILHAKNGAEAVDICKNNKEINLVLMDIKMPKMDGYEAARKIKKFMPYIPIIAQTAYSSEQDKLQAINNGMNDFIKKPINKDEFINMILKYAES